MKTKDYRKMMAFGEKLFRQEQAKFNGDMRFAYLNDDETGEMVLYSPDEATSSRIRKCLNLEFLKL